MTRQYAAFISYRHCPLDIVVAERIHKSIERFRIPGDLRREEQKQPGSVFTNWKDHAPGKHLLVFRDREELPLSNNLTADIFEALDNSTCLIVVCTPDTPKSLWVRREISYFMEKHGRERIITVLAAGTPEESIPREITTVYDTDGVTVLEEFEPLVAYLTADTRKKVLKNLDKELLRLCAAILGCPYDSLRQRHKRRKMQQTMAAVVAAFLVAVSFIGMLVNRNARSIRYIAICTGNDLLNAEIAGELQPYLNRRGYTIPVYQCSPNGVRYKVNAEKVVCHGIYTPELLCSDQIDQMAMVLNHSYCGSGTARENWLKCDYFSRMSSRASADFSTALLHCAGVSSHEALEHWDPQGELLENLSKTEHLRWCAFHYSMGFRAMRREEFEARAAIFRREQAETGSGKIRISKDLNQRIHACLIPWEELDELSARENAVTGKNTDYKEADRKNVRAIPGVLHAMDE